MKVTEVRLTLAAYIYSIEDDLRDIIRNYIVPYSEGNSFLGNEQIVQKVEARYKKDNPYLIPSENLYDLVDYIMEKLSPSINDESEDFENDED